jgi:hypothetical protein
MLQHIPELGFASILCSLGVPSNPYRGSEFATAVCVVKAIIASAERDAARRPVRR